MRATRHTKLMGNLLSNMLSMSGDDGVGVVVEATSDSRRLMHL